MQRLIAPRSFRTKLGIFIIKKQVIKDAKSEICYHRSCFDIIILSISDVSRQKDYNVLKQNYQNFIEQVTSNQLKDESFN